MAVDALTEVTTCDDDLHGIDDSDLRSAARTRPPQSAPGGTPNGFIPNEVSTSLSGRPQDIHFQVGRSRRSPQVDGGDLKDDVEQSNVQDFFASQLQDTLRFLAAQNETTYRFVLTHDEARQAAEAQVRRLKQTGAWVQLADEPTKHHTGISRLPPLVVSAQAQDVTIETPQPKSAGPPMTPSFLSPNPPDVATAAVLEATERSNLPGSCSEIDDVNDNTAVPSTDRKRARPSNMARLSIASDGSEEATVAPTKMVGSYSRTHTTLVPDEADMKAEVRNAVLHGGRINQSPYKTSGRCAAVARSNWFENLTFFVIAFNAIWIAYDTDTNGSKTLLECDLWFQVIEHLVCLFFVCEASIRWFAFKNAAAALEPWFTFDVFLAAFMVLETWVFTFIIIAFDFDSSAGGSGKTAVLRVFRLARLTRLARIAKLVHAFPELMILVKGMSVATRSVFFTFALLVVVLYIFGIAFTHLMSGTGVGDESFSNVLHSMSTLMLHGCLGEDFPDLAKAVGEVSYVSAAILMLFVVVATLTVMNLLVGILVEVVSVVAAVEKEQMTCNVLMMHMQDALQELDADCDNLISEEEFKEIVKIPEIGKALKGIGVDLNDLLDLTDVIFPEGRNLPFPAFMEVVLQLRGSNMATVKDVVSLRRFVMRRFCKVEQQLTKLLTLSRKGGVSSLYSPQRCASMMNDSGDDYDSDDEVIRLKHTPDPVQTSTGPASTLACKFGFAR